VGRALPHRENGVHMTTQESFKRRIRARMAKTGERYGAARRALIAEPNGGAGRRWVADPPHAETKLRGETGRGWDEWVDLVLAGPGADAGHTEIASWLREEHDVHPWWAQGITVGFERITGKRLPGQMPDGTFTITRSRTMAGDASHVRDSWEDDAVRDGILPGLQTQRLSRPGVRLPRYAIADDDGDQGVLSLTVEQVKDRVRAVVTHEKIPDLPETERWKAFWELWLDDLAASLAE